MLTNDGGSFGRILESAVVATWPDVVRGLPTDLVHVEYHLTASGVLDHLQVWSCIGKGHWLMVCGYQMAGSEFHDTGVRFHNGYQSNSLARILDLVILHQKAFSTPRHLGRAGLLQISTPTQAATAAAEVSINETFHHIKCGPTEPLHS
jgi:hypothetical protein